MNGAFLESTRDDSTNGLGDPMRAQFSYYMPSKKHRAYDEATVSALQKLRLLNIQSGNATASQPNV